MNSESKVESEVNESKVVESESESKVVESESKVVESESKVESKAVKKSHVSDLLGSVLQRQEIVTGGLQASMAAINTILSVINDEEARRLWNLFIEHSVIHNKSDTEYVRERQLRNMQFYLQMMHDFAENDTQDLDMTRTLFKNMFSLQ